MNKVSRKIKESNKKSRLYYISSQISIATKNCTFRKTDKQAMATKISKFLTHS